MQGQRPTRQELLEAVDGLMAQNAGQQEIIDGFKARDARWQEQVKELQETVATITARDTPQKLKL